MLIDTKRILYELFTVITADGIFFTSLQFERDLLVSGIFQFQRRIVFIVSLQIPFIPI